MSGQNHNITCISKFWGVNSDCNYPIFSMFFPFKQQSANTSLKDYLRSFSENENEEGQLEMLLNLCQ